MWEGMALVNGPTSPPFTTLCQEIQEEPPCMCNWPKCAELRRTGLQVLPPDHAWCGPILQFQHGGSTNKKLAMKYSIVHHLGISKKQRENKTYFIHRHHFSLLGWSHSPHQKTKYIDSNTAKKWDETLGRKAYNDSINSLHYILGKQMSKTLTKGEDGKFVEAPIVTTAEVEYELHCHMTGPSERSERATKRDANPLVGTVSKKMKSVPIITPASAGTPAKAAAMSTKIETPVTKASAMQHSPMRPMEESPMNPFRPSLDKIHQLLSDQFFMRFKGDSKAFFNSKENVQQTLQDLAVPKREKK